MMQEVGPTNRWFAGTRHIDEIEPLAVELLKRVFPTQYADHRLVASIVGNLALYTALTPPGDTLMSPEASTELRRPGARQLHKDGSRQPVVRGRIRPRSATAGHSARSRSDSVGIHRTSDSSTPSPSRSPRTSGRWRT